MENNGVSSLTVEEKYIIECLMSFLMETAFPAVPDALNWAVFTKKINSHLLAGLFAQRLKSGGISFWPEEVIQRLYRSRLLAGLRGEAYSRELSNILKVFRETGQRVVVLKGWSLIPSLYQNDISQRISSDVDILVPLKNAEYGEHLLDEQGYVSDEPWPGFYRQYTINVPFTKQLSKPTYEKSVTIELHWGLMHVPYFNSRIDLDSIFDRAVPLEIAGESALALALEDHLVYTCAHLLHHRHQFILARWFELALWLNKYKAEIDWMAVFERAQQWRLSAGLQYVFSIIEELWPGIIPSDRVEQSNKLHSGWIDRIIHTYEDAGSPNTRPLIVFATLPLKQKFGYFFKFTFPNQAYMMKHYGAAPLGIWPLLYVTRYFRFWEFFKQLFSPGVGPGVKKG